MLEGGGWIVEGGGWRLAYERWSLLGGGSVRNMIVGNWRV